MALALPLVDAVPPAMRLAAMFAGAVVFSTALATVTYYGIERPMIRLGNRLLRPAAPRAVPVIRTM